MNSRPVLKMWANDLLDHLHETYCRLKCKFIHFAFLVLLLNEIESPTASLANLHRKSTRKTRNCRNKNQFANKSKTGKDWKYEKMNARISSGYLFMRMLIPSPVAVMAEKAPHEHHI